MLLSSALVMPMVLVLQLWLVGFGAAANAFKAEERLHSNAVSASNKDSPSAEGILPDKNEVPGELLSKPMELILIGVSRLLAEALEESRLWRTIVGWLNALVKLVATTLGIDKFEQKNSVPSVSTASNSVLRDRRDHVYPEEKLNINLPFGINVDYDDIKFMERFVLDTVDVVQAWQHKRRSEV